VDVAGRFGNWAGALAKSQLLISSKRGSSLAGAMIKISAKLKRLAKKKI
jgi:hypothetical protein